MLIWIWLKLYQQPALKGVLKKTSGAKSLHATTVSITANDSENSSELSAATAKKVKRGIKWADEHGSNLRDVRLIEVEKIRNTVASYKNHKDLVKKERQFEKEAHLSKVCLLFVMFW